MTQSIEKDMIREINAMCQLSHKNLVKMQKLIYNKEYYGKFSNQPKYIIIGIVMEYAERGDVFDFVRKTRRFDSKMTRYFFKQHIYGKIKNKIIIISQNQIKKNFFHI